MRACRPTNFSWIVEGLLAGSAFPSHGGHFQYLVDVGVQHLVTLTEYTPPLQLIPSGLYVQELFLLKCFQRLQLESGCYGAMKNYGGQGRTLDARTAGTVTRRAPPLTIGGIIRRLGR